MRILHLPTEIAGQANLSAQGLRAINQVAKNSARPNKLGYQVDIDPRLRDIPLLRDTRNPLLFFRWLKEFDLFHYHKSPYLPWGIDIHLLCRQHKPWVVEFWGSDIRLDDLEKKRNSYFVADNASNQQRKLARLQFWSSHTDEVIISDHSADIFLQPYFKKIHIVGQRVDTSRYTPYYPSPTNQRPKILHAPSIKATKGTKHVIAAIDNLKKKGLTFDYVEVTGVNHAEAMMMYAKADIIIDQLLMGSHGVFACEAMALGKPVVCYILAELVSTYPEGFPIVNANPDTLEKVLEELLVSPEIRHKIGQKSRAYAEKVHDIKVVAHKLLDIYNRKLSP